MKVRLGLAAVLGVGLRHGLVRVVDVGPSEYPSLLKVDGAVYCVPAGVDGVVVVHGPVAQVQRDLFEDDDERYYFPPAYVPTLQEMTMIRKLLPGAGNG